MWSIPPTAYFLVFIICLMALPTARSRRDMAPYPSWMKTSRLLELQWLPSMVSLMVRFDSVEHSFISGRILVDPSERL